MKQSKTNKPRKTRNNHTTAYERKLAFHKAKFLDAYRAFPHQELACKASGTTSDTVYSWREKDKAFEREFLKAKSRRFEMAEDEAFRRGVKGFSGRPVLYRGKIKVKVTEYSDGLLGRLLAAHDKRYRAKPTDEQGGADVHHIPIEVNFNVAAPSTNERGTPSQAPR